MKKIIAIAFLPWLLSGFGYKAIAQEKQDKEEKVTQEIIIRKKGDKDANLKLEFKDDQVLVNGKPLVEFNDDEIIINNRKITINGIQSFKNFQDLEGMLQGFGNGFNIQPGEPKTFLGVTTSADPAGAKIEAVTPHSPAEEAGFQKSDIITKVGSDKINGPEDLMQSISKMNKGDEVKIHFTRDGKKKTAKVTLSETQRNRVFSLTVPGTGSRSLTIPRVGRIPWVENLSPDFQWDVRGTFFNQKPKLGIKIQDTPDESGVKILEVEEGSVSEKAGLKPDDVLVLINDTQIHTTDDAREALNLQKDKSSYPVKVNRAGKEMSLNITIPKILKTVEL